MRSGVLLMAVSLVFFAMPVKAAEQGVIVINPDGTITESDAPKIPQVKKAVPKAKPAPAKIVKPKKAPAAKAAAVPASPKIKWNKPPKAGKKPVEAEAAPARMPVAEIHRVGPISRDQALRAAIQVAPPFKSARAVPDQYKGRNIFRVILQTEDGQQDILVDSLTGDVLR